MNATPTVEIEKTTPAKKRTKKKKSAARTSKVPEFLKTLRDEHSYFKSLLDIVSEQQKFLADGKDVDLQILQDALHYLSEYPEDYHHPREDLLFASLARNDRGFGKFEKRLEREHRTIRTYNEQLFAELRGITAGRRVQQHQLRQSLQRYVSGYRQHLRFESREIFPRAKGKLNKRELQRLSAKTRYIDDPIFGTEVQKRYRRLVRHLVASAADLGFDLASAEMTLLVDAEAE